MVHKHTPTASLRPTSQSQRRPIALVRLVDAPIDHLSAAEMHPSTEALTLSEEQQEVVDTRESLGLSWRDYAVLLGVAPARLNTYRYGRSVGVPPEVMAAVRALRSMSTSELEVLRVRLSLPMSEIVAEWLAVLQIQSSEDLAALLGIPAVVVKRWRADEARPETPEIARLARTVSAIARLSSKDDLAGDGFTLEI